MTQSRVAGAVTDAEVEAFGKEMYGADWPDYAAEIRIALTAAHKRGKHNV